MPPPVYAVWKMRHSNKDIGNTIIDLGKLVFAGIVLNAVVNGLAVAGWQLLIGGIITTALLLIVGITINRKEE
jgi:hypothetical protein